jgi:hypothetical protein
MESESKIHPLDSAKKNLKRNLGIIKRRRAIVLLMERRNESCAEGIKMGRLNALIKGWGLVLMTAFYL